MNSQSLRRTMAGCCSTIVLLASTSGSAVADPAAPPVEFAQGEKHLTVAIDGLPVATYCFKDEKIKRTYFAHVRAPSGVQVTRHHPPIEGRDLMDHDTFHPGIWMSFGDISGSDYWRNMARVEHVEFVQEPEGQPGVGTFAVRNRYLAQSDPSQIVCEELCHFTILVRPAGYLLRWDSRFSHDKEFYFGDQEEMGLGFRVATPLRVAANGDGGVPPGNGTIRDSEARTNESEIWGNTADWCDYRGEMAGHRVGMAIFCHPDNFRPSWFHARDYGLLEANPFGRQAFGKGEPSKVLIKPGKRMRLRYGVLIHSGPRGTSPDLQAAYADYLTVAD